MNATMIGRLCCYNPQRRTSTTRGDWRGCTGSFGRNGYWINGLGLMMESEGAVRHRRWRGGR